jgi:catechol 2,3-dioxygenase
MAPTAAPLRDAPASALLPAGTAVGSATLRVAEAERSLGLYHDILGLSVIERSKQRIALGGAGGKPFLILEISPGAPPRPLEGFTGLYHVAILVPDRATLGGALARILDARLRLGSADHKVSEALYIYDPDGNGLELYRDRPSEQWDWRNGRLRMGTDPLDLKSLRAEGVGQESKPLPAATRIGHVHLQVADLDDARRFYCDVLGFEQTAGRGGALFVSAGGYHHHVGLNVWDSLNAPQPPASMAGLVEFVIALPDAAALAATRTRIEAAGGATEPAGRDLLVRDPWQNLIRLRSP